MADVIEGGPSRPPRRWLRAAPVLAVVVAGWILVHGTGGGPSGGPPVPASPVPASPLPPSSSASLTRDFSGPAQPAGGAPAWPSREGACGAVARLPLTETPRPSWRPRTRLLVGGAGVRRLDTGAGDATSMRGLPTDAEVTALLRAPDGIYALATRGCRHDRVNLYRLHAGSAARVPLARHGGLRVVAGPHGVWQVLEPATRVGPGGTVVRAVGTGRTVRLPVGASLVADTAAGFVVVLDGGRGPSRVAVFGTTGARLRVLGRGVALAATRAGRVLMTPGGCPVDGAAPCRLRAVDAASGTVTGRYRLPAGRGLTSPVTMDPGGRVAAFTLGRAHPESRYRTGHPLPPSDVAVLDLRTGALRLVPRLELAPKALVGLAVGRGAEWLFLTVSDGDHVRVLAWERPMAGAVVLAELPGAVTGGPPVLPLGTG